MSLIERDKKVVWHPFTQHKTAGDHLEIVKASGVLLFDADGKEYIDANSSWWVNVHGHAHPHIGKAISDQFNTVDHVVFAGVTHSKAVEIAERIVEKSPANLKKVFFSDNGSTAVEVGLKVAFQYFHNQDKSRKKVVALNGAYHGDTFGAMSVGQRGYFNAPFESFFFDVDYLDFPTTENREAILSHARELFSSKEVAVFIVEPLVQGAAGMRMYSPEILDELTAIAHEFGSLVIFDEVMTGFGRTGKLFAMDHCKNKPDIVALSKGLTAGVMAMGLTVTSQEVYDAFLSEEKTKAFLHGHSFTANPISCAVACASLDIFEEKQTIENMASLVNWGTEFIDELKTLDNVRNTRQSGTIVAFELETGEGDTYFSDIRERAYDYFLEQGILLRPLGNTLFVNPPYSISKVEYTKIKEAILSFLQSI
ncbi:MAG: adenosylmethionine--8-amino-7-oxononanoate transaminase [Crocinitomicaceae bacterium]|nr:adenosylmethionine--8-amino-7-oxononanoate transaminase [Flavobacteriales bacterium]NQZ37450.1 adenosylmethionine--8-amino-7-oxononanoate transaminase [Crocinitomicaceae bacterium]